MPSAAQSSPTITTISDTWMAACLAQVPPGLQPAGTTLAELLAGLWQLPTLPAAQRPALAAALCQHLPQLPDPCQALSLLALLLETQAEHADYAAWFTPARLRDLLILFAGSPQLGRALLRHPEDVATLLPVAPETPAAQLARLQAEPLPPAPAADAAGPADPATLAHLRRRKAQEYIRIALSDFRHLDEFSDTVRKISQVADYTMQHALAGAGLADQPVAVIAMGKWGGLELNYSSDIDLLFVAGDDLDPELLADLQYRAATAIRLLDQATADGFVFRVDNRLRPEGSSGALVRSLRQYQLYYERAGRGWEFQALIKARTAAGDAAVGAAFIAATRPLVFRSEVPPETVLREVREMKAKIESALILRKSDSGNVKLGRGGIRDIEFIIQFLQLHHGRQNPDLRVASTLVALKRFLVHGVITEEEYQVLTSEYLFLRVVEHHLQITDDLPIRQLPTDPVAANILGRQVGYTAPDGGAGAWLLARYAQAIRHTRKIFNDFFDTTILFLERKQHVRELCPDLDAALIEAHFNRLESAYFLRFDAADIARHIRMMAGLSPTQLSQVARDTSDPARWRITIVAYDYLGEFSKICGLLSANHLNIISGESFTYAAAPSASAGQVLTRRPFYRRPARQYYTAAEPSGAPTDSRKIVCVAYVQPAPAPAADSAAPPLTWADFERDLAEVLAMLRDGQQREASERVTLLAISRWAPATRRHGAPRVLPPIELTIDNESDHLYTILEVTSPDQFMFLFAFTNALTTRNYYIGRVEINTLAGQVHDRLFLTTVDGRKIVDPAHLRDLRITLTLMKQFGAFLADAPNPYQALKQFSELVDHVLAANTEGIIPIIEDQALMADFARLLGSSAYLWEDVLRMQYHNLLPLLMDARSLDAPATVPTLRRHLRTALAGLTGEAAAAALNNFKDREMFRLDLRHLTHRVAHFADFCRELTALTDVVLSEALALAAQVAGQGSGQPAPGVCALAGLGKWGGRELGYASDIEIMFVWDAPAARFQEGIEFYERQAQALAQLIHSKRDGIFELDWRLRPGGKSARLAVPYGRFRAYYAPGSEADTFERQALLRLRVVAGDAGLRRRLYARRDAFVFGPAPFDVARILHLRERQQSELVAAGTTNVKFSPGGLCDAEYFIQILQVHHGHARRGARTPNILSAAHALHAAGVLPAEVYQRWLAGYTLLRAVINGLRIVHGNAKHLVLPAHDSRDFLYLVRRLAVFLPVTGHQDLWDDLRRHMAELHALLLQVATYLPAAPGGSRAAS